MTGTASALSFTESLLQVIRQQRHLATRVIIATQEPTISPKLLDLASITIVHRFTSPDWMRSLQSHLAGVSSQDESRRDVQAIFPKIVTLDAGEALLFAPSAMLDFEDDNKHHQQPEIAPTASQTSAGKGKMATTTTAPAVASNASEGLATIHEEQTEEQEEQEDRPGQGQGQERDQEAGPSPAFKLRAKKLGMEYIKVRVRKRLTADGGRSIMAL